MSTAHYMTVCEDHGTIYTQCRCPALDKRVDRVSCLGRDGGCPSPLPPPPVEDDRSLLELAILLLTPSNHEPSDLVRSVISRLQNLRGRL